SSFALTDSGTPVMTLSEGQLFADQDVLSLINSSYALNVTGVLAADVGSLSANPLIDLLSVSDSASNIAANLSALKAANGAGKIDSVTITSGTLVTTDISHAAFLLYQTFTGANGIDLLDVAFSNPDLANLLINGPASLGLSVPIAISFDSNVHAIFDNPGELLALQHGLDNGYITAFNIASTVNVPLLLGFTSLDLA